MAVPPGVGEKVGPARTGVKRGDGLDSPAPVGITIRHRQQADRMTDAPPDRLASNPKSPFHDAAALERGVGVRFKGVEKTNVDEYCVSEGWVRLTIGTTKDRNGAPLTMKFQGTVEPYYRDAN
jgi:Protein of unknown function (DUF3297)